MSYGGKKEEENVTILPTYKIKPYNKGLMIPPETKQKEPEMNYNEIEGLDTDALDEYLKTNTFHRTGNSVEYTLSTATARVIVKTEIPRENIPVFYPNSKLDIKSSIDYLS
jgi:hypothetical protein